MSYHSKRSNTMVRLHNINPVKVILFDWFTQMISLANWITVFTRWWVATSSDSINRMIIVEWYHLQRCLYLSHMRTILRTNPTYSICKGRYNFPNRSTATTAPPPIERALKTDLVTILSVHQTMCYSYFYNIIYTQWAEKSIIMMCCFCVHITS